MSEILPIHALKAQIIQHTLDMMHSAPPQPVPIQLDTWSLRTGDALDPAKRCDPPVLYEGHWYPMICPIEGDFQ